MLALNLNAHLITLMSIKPLTTAHFVMKMNIHLAITISSVENTDGESNRAAQDMLQGKIKHKQIRTSSSVASQWRRHQAKVGGRGGGQTKKLEGIIPSHEKLGVLNAWDL